MAIEQNRPEDDTSSEPDTSAPKTNKGLQKTPTKRPRGRPKGSKNRNKADVVLTGILKQLQTMLMSILPTDKKPSYNSVILCLMDISDTIMRYK